jgi:hypothetical protein
MYVYIYLQIERFQIRPDNHQYGRILLLPILVMAHVERMAWRGSALGPHRTSRFRGTMTTSVANTITSAAIDAPHAAVASPWLSAASRYRQRPISSANLASSHSQTRCHGQMWAKPTAPASLEPPTRQHYHIPHIKPLQPPRAL